MKAYYILVIILLIAAWSLVSEAQAQAAFKPIEATREQVYISMKEELVLTVDIYKLQVEIMSMIMDMQRLSNMESNRELGNQIDILRKLKIYEGRSDDMLIAKLQEQMDYNRKELAQAGLNLEQMDARIKLIEAKIAEYYQRIIRSGEMLISQVQKDSNPALPPSILSDLQSSYKIMASATVASGMDPVAFATFQKTAEDYMKYLTSNSAKLNEVAKGIQARNEDFASAQAAQMQYTQLLAYVSAFRELLEQKLYEKDELQKRFDEMKQLPFGKTYQDRIYFESGSVVLNSDAIRILGEFARSVPQTDDYEILITGFCDDTPIGPKLKKTYASNWELSLARSSAVVRYMLETLKFPPERIIIAGKGEFDTANLNKADKQLSRRVEFRFVPREIK